VPDLKNDLLKRFMPVLVLWPDHAEEISLADKLYWAVAAIPDKDPEEDEQISSLRRLLEKIRNFPTDYQPRPAELILDSTLAVDHHPYAIRLEILDTVNLIFRKDQPSSVFSLLSLVSRLVRIYTGFLVVVWSLEVALLPVLRSFIWLLALTLGNRTRFVYYPLALLPALFSLVFFWSMASVPRLQSQRYFANPKNRLSPEMIKAIKEAFRRSYLVGRCGGPGNARLHRDFYKSRVSEDYLSSKPKYPRTVYARAMKVHRHGVTWTILQYWYCYFYNDWANSHEGDWESVTVVVRPKNGVVEPSTKEDYEGVACAVTNHTVGWRTKWCDVVKDEKEGGDGIRPVIFVARGSHAYYFRYGRYSPTMNVGGLSIRRVELRFLPFLSHMFGDPAMRDEPPPDDTDYYVRDWELRPLDTAAAPWWLDYSGLWGGPAPFWAKGSEAPRGPKFQPSSVWDHPYDWIEEECADWPPSFFESSPPGPPPSRRWPAPSPK